MKRTWSKGRKQFMSNLRSARRLWPNLLHKIQIKGLETLSTRYSLSVPAGDLLFLDGRWYVTHAGLLHVSQLNRCAGIRIQPMREFCDASISRWVFKATVFNKPTSRGFVGLRRRRSLQCLVLGPRCRDARRRNPRSQPRPPQGLRHRALFGRGARLGSQN